jgi:hypothetical protein
LSTGVLLNSGLFYVWVDEYHKRKIGIGGGTKMGSQVRPKILLGRTASDQPKKPSRKSLLSGNDFGDAAFGST